MRWKARKRRNAAPTSDRLPDGRGSVTLSILHERRRRAVTPAAHSETTEVVHWRTSTRRAPDG